jgi:cell division protein FtsI (penicillin-binding protein 3)
MIFDPRIRKASKLIGERSSSFDLARGRLVLLSGLFVLVYMMLAARAIDLTIIQVNIAESGDKEVSALISPAPVFARANITDRNGVLLATTLKTATLYADPELISSKKDAAAGLAKIFPDLPYGDLLQKLQSDRRFISLRRDLNPAEQYAVLELGEPGLAFQQEDRRVYPQGPLASHLVGYASIDRQGLAGVERSFNNYLNEDGPLRLTIDIRLQHTLRRELLKAMRDFSAAGAAGIVMDARNGEILAGVSLPDFDPHEAGSAGKDKIFNRLTLGTYELGSVFKIFSTAAFLETHDVPLSTTFDASQPLKYGKFKIEDYHAENRILTIPEVFMHSSNIGTAMMGEAVGGTRLKKFYGDIGLLEPLEFEIQEVGKPQVPSPWREINTITASYGHGITTTPLQLASAVSSIINGGMLVHPRLVMDAQAARAETGERVVSEKTAHRMRQLLRLVVTDGTGSKADVPGYNVGGKTGTAEKNNAGRYEKNKLISSFVAAFPIESPRYVVYVLVDEPRGNKQSYNFATAGWVAAPAAARVITSMASILGIPPEAVPAAQDLSFSLKQFVSVKTHE